MGLIRKCKNYLARPAQALQDAVKAAAGTPEAQQFLLDASTSNPGTWLAMHVLEPRFVYNPNYVYDYSDPGRKLKHPSEYGLHRFSPLTLTSGRKETLTAWYAPASKQGYPTIAFCHGKSGGLDMNREFLRQLADRGYGVMAVAYPGFKGSKGTGLLDRQPCTENGCYRAAHAMLRHLITEERVPPGKIALYGFSMGGAVALRVAKEMEEGNHRSGQIPIPLGAVACYGTFASLPMRAREEYRRVPTKQLMENHFDSLAVIPEIRRTPGLLLHGNRDEVTGAHHSDMLFNASSGNFEFHRLNGLNHRLVSLNAAGKEFVDFAKVRRVIDQLDDFLIARGIYTLQKDRCHDTVLDLAVGDETVVIHREQVKQSRGPEENGWRRGIA